MAQYLVGPPKTSGSSHDIVKILKDYKGRLPQDFVAHLLGWKKSDVTTQLEAMEEAGIVRLVGDDVELVWQK